MYDYLIGIIAVIVLVILYLRLRGRGDRQEFARYIERLSVFFEEVEKLRKQYIPHSELLRFQEAWKAFYNDPVGSTPKALKIDTIQMFRSIYSQLNSKVDIWNDEFIEREMRERREWFSSYNGRSLDEQQRRAILTNEDNTLVVAGAGCGKTLTIMAKIEYLVNILGVLPSKILLLAFNKSAAQELTERLQKKGIQVEAQTFHSFGLKIIVESDYMKPKVDDQDILKKVIHEYISNASKDSTECNKLLSFFGLYSYVLTDESSYRVLGEMYEHNRGFDLQTMKEQYKANREKRETLKGEKMKSIEETVIANFLFLHGVEYEYEKMYPFKGDDYRRNYTPDFYLPEYNIWLEHFGVDKNGETPWLSPIEGRRYVSEMKWKREMHKKNNTKLIESYSHWKSEGKFVARIDALLRENGVEYKPIDAQDVYRTLYLEANSDDRTLLEMQKLLHTFICLVKENSEITFEGLRKKAGGLIADMRTRTMQFLEMAEVISTTYQQLLAEKSTIDFQDMISRATKAVTQGRY